MNQDSNEFTVTTELLTLGNEYCYFIENQSKYDQEYRLSFLMKILSALYLKGSIMKEMDECDDAYMQRYVTEENYETIFNELRQNFAKKDVFYTADPEVGDLIKHSISEVLSDIYQDMKDLYIAYSKGLEAEKKCVAYYMKDWFSDRWGKAISVLLPIIHELFHDLNKQDNLE